MKAASLLTRFTARFGARAPLVLAPMGGCAGGALAAAVSAAGGVGLVGSGGESLAYLREQWAVALAQPGARRPLLGFGVNVRTIEAEPPGTLARLVRELEPAHVYLSFGDIAPHAEAVLGGGAALYSNAGDCEAALAHAAAGASCVVMQGSDAGGHTHERASVFSLVPQARAALDAAGHAQTLLVAAGGISDGRGVAASLVLGADAAVMGTRLAAASESLYTPRQKEALVSVACGAAGTKLGTFIDALNGDGAGPHSSGLPGRVLANNSTALETEWKLAWEGSGHGTALQRKQLTRRHREATAAAGGDGLEWGTTWAGASVGLVREVQPAAAILAEVSEQAAAALRGAAGGVLGLEASLGRLKLGEMRARLAGHGAETKGRKAELLARLLEIERG